MSNNEPNWDERPTQASDAGGQGRALGETWADQPGPSQGGTQGGAPSGSPAGGNQAGPGQYPPVPGQAPAPQTYPSQGGSTSGHPQAQPGSASIGAGYGGYAAQPPQAPQAQTYPSTPGAGQQWSQPATTTGGFPQHPGQQAGQFGAFGAHAPFEQPTTKAGLGRLMGWGVVASALLAIIGCFGTWMYVKVGSGFGDYHASANGLGMTSTNLPDSSSSSNGESFKDGWFVLLPALVALVLGALRALGRLPKAAMWGAFAMGLIATGIAAYDWNDVRTKLDELKTSMDGLGSGATFSAGSGWGLVLCLIAGLALLVTSAVSALRD